MKDGKLDLNYILTLLFLLISANASFIAESNVSWFGLTVLMMLIAVFRKLITNKDLKTILIFSSVFLIYVAIRDTLVNDLDSTFLISDVVFLFKFMYMVYFYCLILKDKAAYYIVKVTVHLTILSFFFFAVQLVSNDLIFKFSTSLGLDWANPIPGYTNFVLFTYVKDFHDHANSGFVWEPSAFGCFLILALMLNFFLNGFKFDRKSNILIVGILTTIGTTDYLALILLLFMVYRYRVPKINAWAIVIIIGFIVAVITVPILGSKITDTYTEDMADMGRIKFLAKYYKRNNEQLLLNRFSSWAYLQQTFGAQLILGVSNKYDEIVNKSFDINISNGLADFLAKYGVLWLIFLVYKYAKFCLHYVLKVEFVIYSVLIFLVMGFGEPVLSLPVFLIFVFIQLEQIMPVTVKRGRVADMLDEADRRSGRTYPVSPAR